LNVFGCHYPMASFRRRSDMNIHTQHGSHGSIFPHCVDKTGGILLQNRIFMRGFGFAASSAGSGMGATIGRFFLRTTTTTTAPRKSYHGIMMGHCVGVSVASLLRNCASLHYFVVRGSHSSLLRNCASLHYFVVRASLNESDV